MTDTREARTFASEIKFVVDHDLGVQIREWVRAHLDPDPHGTGPFGDEYETVSLYFDTEDHDVFHRRGSFARAKFRVRRYTEADVIFLERKLRRPHMVVKRRTRASLDVLDRLMQPDSDPSWSAEWFHQRLQLRRLSPVCQVSYQRTARTAAVDGTLARLTLDEGIRVAPAEDVRFGADAGVPVLHRRMVLELKYRVDLPAVFKRLVEEFALQTQTASKYRLGMMVLGHVAQVAMHEAPDHSVVKAP
ncbi:MAG: polyphosphate polymerase domain-containing protein [Vicinamibacterales bacterium]